MSLLLNMELSMVHRLRTIAVCGGWVTRITGQALTKYTSLSLDGSTVWSYGMPELKSWVAITNTGEVNPSGVNVYIGGQPANVPYNIDYENGLVVFNGNPGGAVTADFTQYSMVVRRGHPDRQYVDVGQLPIVAIDPPSSRNVPFAIGTPRAKICKISTSVLIMTLTPGERLRISELLNDMLRWIPICDMASNQPLLFGGRINPGFVYAQSLIGMAQFRTQYPSSTILSPVRNRTNKEFHQGTVNLNFEFYPQ